MTNQQPTPATPYDRSIERHEAAVDEGRGGYVIENILVTERDQRAGYLRALSDVAPRLAALDGVTGPLCATCGGKGEYVHSVTLTLQAKGWTLAAIARELAVTPNAVPGWARHRLFGFDEIADVLNSSMGNSRIVRVHPGASIMAEVRFNDEWCAEAFMETDYADLAQVDFERELRKYAAFRILNQ